MMNNQKKRIPALLTAAALLLAVGVTTALATSAKEPEPAGSPAELLASSITCDGETLSFTLPDADVEWDLWISGRVLGDSTRVHYLEEESVSRSWEPGETYQFQLAEAAYDDLTVNGRAGAEMIDMDLLPYVPQLGSRVFSATVEANWAEVLAPYLPLGLEYTFDDPDGDGNGLRMTLRGREVRGIIDGETWITEHTGNSLFDADAGEVRTVYTDGVLTGLEFLSEEEQAIYTAQRENSGLMGMVWPVTEFKCISNAFGSRTDPGGQSVTVHNGVDIAANRGTDVFAVLDGTVTEAGYDAALGYYALVDHGDGLETLYAQCQKLLVGAEDAVEQGQVIAKVGSTGQSTGPHLHFEIRQDGEPQDPFLYVYGPEFLQSRK